MDNRPSKQQLIAVYMKTMEAVQNGYYTTEDGTEVKLNDENHLVPNDVAVTKNKMRTILRIGLIHGHDAIVLGAFGCGAFGNPPRHIAELFKETINEKEFKSKYRKIVFAVIDDHNSGKGGNYQPFKEVFS